MPGLPSPPNPCTSVSQALNPHIRVYQHPKPMRWGLPILAPSPPGCLSAGSSGPQSGTGGCWGPHSLVSSRCQHLGQGASSLRWQYGSGDSHDHPKPQAQEVLPSRDHTPSPSSHTDPPACPPPWAEPSHNSSDVISLDKPFAKGSLASAAHLRYQTWGPGCTGELGASQCHPKLPHCSPSPSLTSSSEATARMGFAPEPVEDGSGTERNKFSHQMQLRFPSTPIKTWLSLPRSLCCPPAWSLYPPPAPLVRSGRGPRCPQLAERGRDGCMFGEGSKAAGKHRRAVSPVLFKNATFTQTLQKPPASEGPMHGPRDFPAWLCPGRASAFRDQRTLVLAPSVGGQGAGATAPSSHPHIQHPRSTPWHEGRLTQVGTDLPASASAPPGGF